MSENQVETKTSNGFWAKFGKWIMFALAGLATLLTLGALARKNAGATPIDGGVQKKLDALDKEVIADVVAEANVTNVSIEAAQKKAVETSAAGNNAVDKVKQDFDSAETPEEKIAKLNAGMKNRRS